MLKKRNKKRAFTLIELIVVIAIIGVLVGILVPVMSGFIGNARTQTAKSNARDIYSIAQAEYQYLSTTTAAPAATTYTAAAGATPSGTDYLSQVITQAGKISSGGYSITVGTGAVTSVSYTPTDGSGAQTYP